MRTNILITGASSGLGRGMALEYAARGHNLALCARRVERLETLKQELERRYPAIRVVIRELDVLDYDQVFEVFQAFHQELGRLDRVIVNAGVGQGRPLGTGHFRVNQQTAETNFVAALAQCEAALEIFRSQNDGHLVVISSVSAMRGMPRNLTTYAASKAGIATLAEGIRADLLGTPIRVTTLFPGYIRTAINEKVKNAPFMIDTEAGCRLLVEAIDREPAEATVPRWPWAAVSLLMRYLPLPVVARMV